MPRMDTHYTLWEQLAERRDSQLLAVSDQISRQQGGERGDTLIILWDMWHQRHGDCWWPGWCEAIRGIWGRLCRVLWGGGGPHPTAWHHCRYNSSMSSVILEYIWFQLWEDWLSSSNNRWWCSSWEGEVLLSLRMKILRLTSIKFPIHLMSMTCLR